MADSTYGKFDLARMRRRIGRRFVREESGSVTVEFVLWIPIFIIIMFLVIDVCILFITQANMWAVARDTTRRVATHEFDKATAEAYAVSNASWGALAYTVVVDDVGPEVSTDIQISVSDASLFDLLGAATAIGGNIQARVTQRLEPY